MSDWNKLDQSLVPTADTFRSYVNNPLWEEFCDHVEQTYQPKRLIAYSRCSGAPGWNMKYQKAGRSLCTLYPMEGCFIALVVIGQREKQETELTLPSFTSYVQDVYQRADQVMNQRWLMIEVQDAAALEDVKRCIAIRRGVKKPS